MEWAAWAGKLGAKIGGKMALNACLPGLGSTIDFAEAAKCFYDGDVCGGLISAGSGVVDLITLGLVGATKEAMKESTKGAVVQSAKDTTKSAATEASRKVGQELGKQFAMGATKGGKDAATKMAKVLMESTSKEATRKVGQEVGKELAKGVTTEAVEEVVQAGTKMTVNKFLQDCVQRAASGLAAVSSGGRQLWKTTLEDVGEKLMFEALKQNPKEIAFQLTKTTAEKGVNVLAKSACKEASRKVCQQVVKDLGKSATTKAAEEVFQAGTKMTIDKFLQRAGLAAVSNGGRQVWKTTLGDVGEKLIFEALKQSPKEIAFALAKNAAEKEAEEEFIRNALSNSLLKSPEEIVFELAKKAAEKGAEEEFIRNALSNSLLKSPA